ncbi:t-SNARE coiled-coil-like proteiny domain-containing protein [Entamoeba marina]
MTDDNFSREQELLWEERDHINRSSALADILIDQAFEDNESIDRQRATLAEVNNRGSIYRGTLLDSDRITKCISWHQCKNTIVLAIVIAFCIFFFDMVDIPLIIKIFSYCYLQRQLHSITTNY